MGLKISKLEDETVDPIEPTSIEHKCDDIVIEGRLEQRYNHLVYAFERDGVLLTARAYLDEIETVSLLGCFVSRPVPRTLTECPPSLRNDAIAYLRRRYAKIQELTRTGYRKIKS